MYCKHACIVLASAMAPDADLSLYSLLLNTDLVSQSFQILIFNLTMDWSDLAPDLFLIAQVIYQSWIQIKPKFVYPSQISSNLYMWMFDNLSLPELKGTLILTCPNMKYLSLPPNLLFLCFSYTYHPVSHQSRCFIHCWAFLHWKLK